MTGVACLRGLVPRVGLAPYSVLAMMLIGSWSAEVDSRVRVLIQNSGCVSSWSSTSDQAGAMVPACNLGNKSPTRLLGSRGCISQHRANHLTIKAAHPTAHGKL